MQKVIVTTSWDDGHILDIKLANLLKKYGIKGTFYISPEDREIKRNKRLNKEQIIELSKSFEIGAHTMTHPHLTDVDSKTAKKEIVQSKQYLENILDKKVTSFCYPAGYYNEKNKRIIKNAGFTLARTVQRFKTDIGKDPFALPTTIHAYRHWSDAVSILKQVGLVQFMNSYFSWDKLAISLFNKTVADGGIFHLWGHSWEIDEHNDWERLERVLQYISNNSKVKYITNRELI